MLERAEQVCAGDGIDERDVAGLLGVLVDKSMLVMQRSGSRVRYRQLETLREFGREQLAASPEYAAVRAAHAAVHAELADDAARGFGGPDEARGWWSSTPRSTTCARRTARPSTPATSTRRCASWSGCASTRGGASATSSSPGPTRRWRCRAPPSTRCSPSRSAWSATGASCAASSTGAIEAGEQAMAAAARLGVATAGLAERAIGNALFYLRREDEAIPLMDRMIDAAKATGAPSLVAHAYYMRSVAETSVGNPAGGTRAGGVVGRRRHREREPDRAGAGRLRPRRVVREHRSRPCARAARPQRATRGVGRQPLDPRLRAHREPGDPGPARATPRRRWRSTAT